MRIKDLDLAAISALLKRRKFQKGEIVYHQEDLPGSLYLTVSGVLKLRLQSPSGKQLTISRIQPGNFFGTISLLDGHERLADAVALEPCELLVLGRDDFRTFLSTHPRESQVLLEITAARWRNTMAHLAALAFLDVPGRLARTLLNLQATSADDTRRDTMTRLTQAELAALIGTSRESVGRWLKTFQQAGLVKVTRGKAQILDSQGLKKYVRW